MIFALILFIFSTAISLYEGSGITDDFPWEWKYSAPFTQLFSGNIEKSSDILYLDYFIYAAKFHPFYPLIMILSILYLIILAGMLLNKITNKTNYLFFILPILCLSTFISTCTLINATTFGGKLFFYLFLILTILFIYLSYYYKKSRKIH
ncbi:DUF4306 domain-containing protein [Rummeliibacillus pycnus]|uniref:DUF4306 domain-containing protein n=1 Tax=Rummeliibacillus pycnus TaxID=101070 RepID=UPI003D2A92B8